RPLALEHLEEVLARAWTQIQNVRPGVRRSRLARRSEDRGEVAWRIGQAGEHRCEGHSRGDARLGEGAYGPQTLPRRRDAGLQPAAEGRVERRDADADPDVRASRGIGEHVNVADDERPAGDQADRRARLTEDPQAAAG